MNGDESSAERAWAQMLAFITGQDRLRALRLELDLGVGKSELLIKLARAPMTLREVAQAAEVDPSAATVAIDRLERRGLVERRAHPGDKRSKLVHLTAAGLRAAETAQRILTEPPPALAALGADDTAALARIFTALNADRPAAY
jgi:DNA-binding MarR family transcriptional regulator